MPKHVMAHMTFREFEQRIAEDPVILLPLGSQEEHGPMSPMGDFMLTEVMASKVAEKTGAIAAPTTPFGYADYFRPIPGGIQLRAETFCLMLRDYIDNFLDHGLKRLVIFNGHSGNAPLIDRVVREIRGQTGVVIPSINVWRLHTAESWAEAYGPGKMSAFGHGGEPLASVYTHFFPQLMRPDLHEAPRNGRKFLGFDTAGFGAVRFDGIDIPMPINVTDLTDNGIASGATDIVSAESGRLVAERIIAVSAKFVEAFAKQTSKA